MCPLSKTALDDCISDLIKCCDLLELLQRDDIPKKLRDGCLELTVLLLRLVSDTLSGDFSTDV